MIRKLCSLSFRNAFLSGLFLLISASNVLVKTGVAQPPPADLDAQAYRALASGSQDELARWRAAGGDPARYAKNNPEAIYDAMGGDRDVEMLEFVLKSGANPNAQRHPNLKGTPILVSPMDRDKIALLLKYGADVNAHAENGYTALSRVLFHPFGETKLPDYPRANQKIRTFTKLEVVKLLVENGAEFNGNLGGGGGAGALGLTRREDEDVIDFLIQRSATLKDTYPSLLTMELAIDQHHADRGSLTVALQMYRDDLALALLERDKRVAANDEFAILEAARRGFTTAALAILNAGAKPNVVDDQGTTPLGWAQKREDAELISALQKAGATRSDKKIKPSFDIPGWDSFDRAVASEIDDIVLLDPPRFDIGIPMPKEEVVFGFYGKDVNKYDAMKCERSVSYSIVADADIQDSIQVGVCETEAVRMRDLARLSKTGLAQIINMLNQSGFEQKTDQVKTLGWEWQQAQYPDHAESYGFPVIAIGHGILWANTVVWVNKTADRAVIVQVSVTQLCGEGGKRINTPLCSDTNKALTDIALRVSRINYKN
ncbi:MAG: hypothetical protein AABZ84_03450 [Pseudomonadota bacterium]